MTGTYHTPDQAYPNGSVIVDLKDSPYKDSTAKNGFDSVSTGKVVMKDGYPHCCNHGAMNKVDASGLWRCLTCNEGCYQTVAIPLSMQEEKKEENALIVYIQERIAYLKKADAEVCETRWDMSKPEFERLMARETSNYLTERRHELEDLLKHIASTPPQEKELWLNMQYYMEYCQMKGYVTPQDWLKNHKHF